MSPTIPVGRKLLMIELRGITWNHTRGYLPTVATAQRFSELHPEVTIHWEKRSLQQFADLRLSDLVERFDLLVIDHPFIGMAAESGLLLPLDDYLAGEFLADQAKHSVGKSHASYQFDHHQWALAIDAATPISGWRRDLLEAKGFSVPHTWKELLELARRGLVAIPGIPLDSLMHFYMVCTGLDEIPFSSGDTLISVDVGLHALEMLRELYTLISPECAHRNPIATWELLTTIHSAAICPFGYGYSNYSREGYTSYPLETGGLIAIEGHTRCRSTLGGGGLAISSQCRQVGAAIDYSQFVASAECQSGLYFQSGGQPGHRLAWLDNDANRASRDFFRNTLATLDEAWLRPRWNGYLDFQDRAAPILHQYLWGGGQGRDLLYRLNELAQQCMKTNTTRGQA
ncbi:MAG: extracellular solute-binding protein [Acidobacteriaceae bacterium]